MSEQMIVRARQNCCRLCLAPDNECISIYGNLVAADKETISSKIHACVNIKVTRDDSLSTRICHLCISYLNCWQSFKNRCISAQRKQQEWLIGANVRLENELYGMRDLHYNESSNNGMNLTTNEKPRHIPIQIKEEPLDESEEVKTDEEDSGRCDIDPTQFLATDVIEEEELKRLAANKNLTITKSGGENGPQILTSLGLQSISNDNVSPFAFLSASLGASADNLHELTSDNKDRISISPGAPSQKPHDCRICKMKFSTRANARRHERNLHGLINDVAMSPLSLSTNQNLSLVQTSSTPKNKRRKSNIGPLTPEMMGIYEYDKPEKYRHMLTEQKLAFIEEFEEFLKQYQTLTCKCCSKVYPKYKNFMAHMRKKYPRLPRASCFKCLKQFESKAIFVSHVKRRNCINLYKLYMNDPTFEKYDKIDKMKAKELLVNKLYECRLCPKEFRLKSDFRNHVYEDHNDVIQKKEASSDSCVFCNLKIEDSVERKRHYNNMECILHIRCSTCNTKFETHQTFLEHVYKDHVPLQTNNSKDSKPSNLLSESSFANDYEENIDMSPHKSSQNESTTSRDVESVPPVKTQFHSRMPQNCKICGARYNNYNNVLRHMEAKHPDQLPQTYKCSLCFVGFPRLSNLREHMWDVHNKKLAKPKRDAEIYCRICLEKFTDKDNWVKHQTEQHDRYICCICYSQYDDVTVFKDHIKIHTSLSHPRQPNSVQNSSNTSQDSTKYTGRFDYVMKDLMSITNGSGGNNDETDRLDYEGPPTKKLKFDHESHESQNELDLSNKLETNVFGEQQLAHPTSSIISNSNEDQKESTAKQLANLYECNICHSLFNSSQGLSNHMRAHNAHEIARRTSLGLPLTKEQKQNVLDNENKFTKNNQVLALEHRFRRMRCRLCQKRFSSKKVYRRHMLVDHHVQNVQFIHCAICRAEFAHEKGLKVHMIKIHGKILRDIGIENLQYECDVCSIVYKSEEELMSHKQTVHNLEIDLSKDGTNVSNTNSNSSNKNKNTKNNNKNNNNNNNSNNDNISLKQTNEGNQYWFQCRYCASNFDSNKKLAIHINIHDEFDSSDYSCKDCGNVYSGRKSLWVHRYKKHPVLPSPSFCDICNKMFFTKDHVEFHMQHVHKMHNNKNHMNQHNSMDGGSSSRSYNKNNNETCDSNSEHRTSEDDLHKEIIHVSGEDVQTVQLSVQQIPQVPCSVCQMKFSDEEAFTKHMKIHEESFYTDNPLASMFDTEPEDPDLVLQKRINENGEFVCDICPKTFQQLSALKVHRNWHFRSDGKQTQADPNVWRSLAKKRKNSSLSFKCQYCTQTFASSSVLKRHISDLHKEVIKTKLSSDLEKPLECRKCNIYFKTQKEWIEHKTSDIKEISYNLSEWVCDICGKIVTRKDRLIQHMYSHLRESELKAAIEDKKLLNVKYNSESKSDTSEGNSNSKDIHAHNGSNNDKLLYLENNNENKENTNKISGDNSSIDTKDQEVHSDSTSDSDSETDDSDNYNNDEDIENEEEDIENDEEEDKDEYNDEEEMNDTSGPQSCDLCQITFDTAQQLTAHVPTHFFHQAPVEVRNEQIVTEPTSKNDVVKELNENVGGESESEKNIEIKLESNIAEKIHTESEIKIKKEYQENDKKEKSDLISIKKELLDVEPKKYSDKLPFNHKDIIIKKEIPDPVIIMDTDDDECDYSENKQMKPVFPETNDDEDDESIYDHEYDKNVKPIITKLDENPARVTNNADDADEDENDDDDDDDDDEDGDDEGEDDDDEDDDDDDDDDEDGEDEGDDDDNMTETVGEEVIGEEVVHDDNAEYHENNTIDSNSCSDSNSVPAAKSVAVHNGENDNDNDKEDENNEDNGKYVNFMDDDDDDDDEENSDEEIEDEQDENTEIE